MDFALARLEGVGRERSMHFDPRWTHEELNWWEGTGGRGTALLEVGWKDWGGRVPCEKSSTGAMHEAVEVRRPPHACMCPHACTDTALYIVHVSRRNHTVDCLPSLCAAP